MKGLIKLFALATAIGFFVTFCDKCADVTCSANSTCEEGECICLPTHVEHDTGNCACPVGCEAVTKGESCDAE